ncbi:ABC transporter ATP-binding protein [Salinimicrobium flavum]|uniref:Polysaccharide ABC transporter ATP-binding protein n=1 Tax=Salinimicrobium flavum TaxID=1737065 RepID=A0ABW5IZ31_9FLAO
MEEKEVLVKAEGVSKKFCKDLKTSLWYGVKDLVSNLKGNQPERILRDKEFWAVKDINFELRRGECLGLIGHNGAGKSTLLKMLNGLINPDAGKITIKGRVGALIELGAGFNPILTGRENIYNNGAVLGFTRKEIDARLEEIIEFAELREFIDMPVQNYSSGMKVRLGFAVAAQMEPDVLLIDEVLAVGDVGFILKCFKTIDNILPKTAVVFVSHSMPKVSRICNQILLMEKGNVKFSGLDIGKGLDYYYSSFRNNEQNIIFTDGNLELKNSTIINFNNSFQGVPEIKWGEDLEIKLHFSFQRESPFIFILVIYDKEQREIAYLHENTKNLKCKGGSLEFTVKHKTLQLSKGYYTIDVSVHAMKTREPILRISGAISFHVGHPRDIFPPFLLQTEFHQND